MSESIGQDGHPLVASGFQIIPKTKQALSSIARTITDVALGRQALPDHLFGYIPLVQALGATGLGAWRYHSLKMNQQSRAKIQLVVFLIIRIVENDPDYGTLLRNREELFNRLQHELINIYHNPMSREELRSVLKELKRKIRDQELPDPPAKRQRADDEEDLVEVQDNAEEAQAKHDAIMTDLAMALSLEHSDIDSRIEIQPRHEDADSSPDARSTRHARFSSRNQEGIPSPPFTPMGPPNGYTFEYDDEETGDHGFDEPDTSDENSPSPYRTPERGVGFLHPGEVEDGDKWENQGNEEEDGNKKETENEKRDKDEDNEERGEDEDKEDDRDEEEYDGDKDEDKDKDEDEEGDGEEREFEDAKENWSSSSFSAWPLSSSSSSSSSSSDSSYQPRIPVHAPTWNDPPMPARQRPPIEDETLVQRAMKRAFDPNSLGNTKGRMRLKRLYPWLLTEREVRAGATYNAASIPKLSTVTERSSGSSTPDASRTRNGGNETNNRFPARRLVSEDPRSNLFLSGDLPIVPLVDRKKAIREASRSQQQEEQVYDEEYDEKQDEGYEGEESEEVETCDEQPEVEEELEQLQHERQLPQTAIENYGQDVSNIAGDYSPITWSPSDEGLSRTSSRERQYDRDISIEAPPGRSSTRPGLVTRHRAAARLPPRSRSASRTTRARTTAVSPLRASPRHHDHSAPVQPVSPVPAIPAPTKKKGRPPKITKKAVTESAEPTPERKSKRKTAFKGPYQQ